MLNINLLALLSVAKFPDPEEGGRVAVITTIINH
jgi:hypothetical protein